jgi:tetratricopeptide (TPR) repeat protein
MIEDERLKINFPLATAGNIAVNNLESARQQAWSRFWQEPERPGVAEQIVELEHLAAQFLGDMGAFDRLESLVSQLGRLNADPARTSLIRAQVASMTHRFAEAKECLGQDAIGGKLTEAADRLTLSIDQACGTRLETVLAARRRKAAAPGRLEDLVPLGALLADLREFDEADEIYQRAIGEYQDVSPFAMAWVCFQLGVLWGELVPEPQPSRAAGWYQKAVEYLPDYVKARVHLSEIYLDEGRFEDAEALLIPAVKSGDPEVFWRLADVMLAMERFADSQTQMQSARLGFEGLLKKHLLAFADHGAEFYSGSGDDAGRAFELASINVANRPTLRAFEQQYATAIDAGKSDLASEILATAGKRWRATAAFRLSPLAESHTDYVKN